jgi:hypothetical protein
VASGFIQPTKPRYQKWSVLPAHVPSRRRANSVDIPSAFEPEPIDDDLDYHTPNTSTAGTELSAFAQDLAINESNNDTEDPLVLPPVVNFSWIHPTRTSTPLVRRDRLLVTPGPTPLRLNFTPDSSSLSIELPCSNLPPVPPTQPPVQPPHNMAQPDPKPMPVATDTRAPRFEGED